jgi:regulator of nucleoside diphosphate kinase
MLLETRHLNIPASDALQESTHRHAARALRPFQEAVSRVDVRIRDVNGPRGGIDTECSMTIELVLLDQPLIVTGKGEDAYAAVQAACARLHEAVSRALTRRRRLDRFGVSPDKAASQHPAPASEPEAVAGDAGLVDEENHIAVTAADHERLRKLIQANRDTRDRDAAEALADELDRAEVVPAARIADTVVTMNSRVVFRDEETGESREISLVYPRDSDPERGRISVLAPVGAALLGLSVGQTIDWPLPRGRLKRCRVVSVLYQPEAAGDLPL